MRRLSVVILLVLMTLALSACGGESATPVPAQDGDQAEVDADLDGQENVEGRELEKEAAGEDSDSEVTEQEAEAEAETPDLDPICGLDTCSILGVCYLKDNNRPDNDCQYCSPQSSEAAWTMRPYGWPCDAGKGLCDGSGSCRTATDGDAENEATEAENEATEAESEATEADSEATEADSADAETPESEAEVVDGDVAENEEADSEAPPITPTKFLVGFAEKDITPPLGTVMGAYGAPGGGRKIEGVHDRLRAQVMLFLNDAGQALVLVAMDISGAGFEFGDWNANGDAPGLREMRVSMAAAVSSQLTLAPEQIVLGSSHSFASADAMGFFQKSDNGPDKALLQNMSSKLSLALQMAVESLAEADLYFGSAELAGLSGDSSNCYNGHLDNSIAILQARKKNGTTLFTAINYAKHPTSQGVDNKMASADWIWGYRSEMEKNPALGKAVFFQGLDAAVHDGPLASALDESSAAAQDIPEAVGYTVAAADKPAWIHTYAIGKAVADATKLGLGSLVKADTFEIRHRFVDTSCQLSGGLFMFGENYFKVPKRSLTPIYSADDPGHTGKPVAFTVQHLEVSWHQLGPAEFAVFPGSATPNMGFAAKGHMVRPNRFVLGLGNDSLGYIIDDSSLANDPSKTATEPGELQSYELTFGLGEGGGACIWNALEGLGWFDGAGTP